MATKVKEYEKLPGRKGRVFVYHLLFLGADHILDVSCRLFYESYKRYYFKDIQAIVCRKSNRGKVWTAVFGVILFLFLLPILLAEGEAHWFWKVAATLTLMVLAIHVVRGPTSVCYVKTAVQTEKVLALSRFKIAGQVVNRLRPLIEGAQGALSAEELAASELGRRAPSAARPEGFDLQGRSLRHETGRVHLALFAFLLVETLGTAARFFTDHTAAVVAATLISAGMPVMVIIALVKQYGSDLTALVKGATWAAGGYSVLNFVVGYGLYIYMLIENPDLGKNQWQVMTAAAEISPHDSPFLLGTYIFFLCASLGLAVMGFAGLARTDRTAGTAAGAAAEPESGEK